jgi:D-lactate dehydrogenase
MKTPITALRPEVVSPQPDRVADSFASGTPAKLLAGLEAVLAPGRVLSRALDLTRYASDASAYRMIPQAVVVAHDVTDVAAVLKFAHDCGHSVVFRAGGTSLNGQAQTDGLLVDVRKHWVGVDVLDDGGAVRVRPGSTVAQVNMSLKRYGRIIGPDPASASVACIGGVVANNASGMAAGTKHNSYVTVRSLTFVLPNGTMIDTAADDAEARFTAAAPDLATGLITMKSEIESDQRLVDRIRQKYSIKNTNGYRLDAFLDGDSPLEIFRRLLIGSQGTLAFIAEVVFDTVPLGRLHTTALLIFPTVEAAAEAVPRFVDTGARAVELMDASNLRLAVGKPQTPASWSRLPDEAAGLLVEYRAADEDSLAELRAAADQVVTTLHLWEPAAFTTDNATAAFYWMVRSALMGGVAKSRPPGTTLIVEDVCVPPARIAQAVKDLRRLLARHGYHDSVAGHASVGNLHFLLALNAGSEADRQRYTVFMGELVDLVINTYDGSLKAEHGTGRNMSPFLETEWGAALTEMMWRVKRLADPAGVLAPNVVLNRNPDAHMAHLKSMPTVEALVDACFECGFCEQVCPSRDLTTTPRQRIALRREMVRQPQDSPVQRALIDQYRYDGVQTCAGDSMCSVACPVDIDTGALMKTFRAASHGPNSERVALSAAKHWASMQRAARGALAAGAAAGDGSMTRLTAALRTVISNDLMPAWTARMPAPAPATLPHTTVDGAAAVYFPACINRMFGHSRHSPREVSLPEALVAVSARAGQPVHIADDVGETCCATVWHSKGYEDGNTYMARLVAERLWTWSAHGQLPIVVDATSCTLGLTHDITPYLSDHARARHEKLTIIDSTTWAAKFLLPHLTVRPAVPTAVVHTTCSMTQLGLGNDLATIAAAVAGEVITPDSMTCCGFAGDRGMLHPELSASATAREAEQVRRLDAQAYLSANRTCEVGLEQATGQIYESAILLLEQATR